MTIPNMGFVPGGQQPRGPGGYVQAGPGYEAATQAAQAAQPGQPQQMQHPTQLGMPAPQAIPPGLMGSEGVSPLSQVQPYISQQGLRPQAPVMPQGANPVQQGHPAQYGLQQPYQYNQPQAQPQNTDPLQQPIYDPRLPPELQGKSYAQLAQMNQGLRQLHLQQSMQTPVQQGNVQTPSAQAPAAPAAAPAGQVQFNWAKPDESIGRIVEDKVGALLDQKLGPVVQQGQMSQAQNARNTVAAEIPNYAQLEPYILRRMEGMPASDLANPDTWRVAARVVIGDLALGAHAQQQRGQVQQTPQQPTVPQYQGVYPAQFVQPGAQPVPNLNGFFTEQPTQGGPGPQGVQLTPAQRNVAAAMGMSDADYIAWGAGVPSRNGGPR
jgi:hypothetical protein